MNLETTPLALTKREIERALKRAGCSHKVAKRIVAEGYHGLHDELGHDQTVIEAIRNLSQQVRTS